MSSVLLNLVDQLIKDKRGAKSVSWMHTTSIYVYGMGSNHGYIDLKFFLPLCPFVFRYFVLGKTTVVFRTFESPLSTYIHVCDNDVVPVLVFEHTCTCTTSMTPVQCSTILSTFL